MGWHLIVDFELQNHKNELTLTYALVIFLASLTNLLAVGTGLWAG